MQGIGLLCGTAASVGFLHTVLGPDHYIPFIAMSRIGRWSSRKTVVVTMLCGVAHVLSSVVLGVIGLAFGIAVLKLQSIEEARGDLAGWLLLAFGMAYFAWGVHRAIRNRPHSHLHVHEDGVVHAHEHTHEGEHLHPHAAPFGSADHSHSVRRSADKPERGRMTPWLLFTIFLFGPCEPLIPLLMVPAFTHHWSAVLWVTLTFGVVTLATMTAMVLVGRQATRAASLGRYARYGHALAGLAIIVCGAAVKAGL